MSERLNTSRLIKHWSESSEHDLKTMKDLYNTKNYHWSLFMGHLVIEKLLKAVFVKIKNEYPPLIHDLRRIAEKADLEIEKERRVDLDTISRFNINARYDDVKESFRKLCTKDFTDNWITKIEETRRWIKGML